MNEVSKLSLDAFLTLFRYALIVYLVDKGLSAEEQMAYLNLAGAGVTVLWGLYASGYYNRLVDWLKNLSKDV